MGVFEDLAGRPGHPANLAERAAGYVSREFAEIFHHAAPAASTTPADQPVNLAASTAPAATKETTMPVLADIEHGYQAVKNEVAKFEQALPGALAKAKQFEASPFAAIAEKVAGSVLPPEAVAIGVKAAETVIDDLLALYAPQGTETAPPTVADPVQVTVPDAPDAQ